MTEESKIIYPNGDCTVSKAQRTLLPNWGFDPKIYGVIGAYEEVDATNYPPRTQEEYEQILNGTFNFGVTS